MTEQARAIVDAYRAGTLDRRTFVQRLIALTGSMAAAHLLLESTGLAGTLVSDIESQQIDVT